MSADNYYILRKHPGGGYTYIQAFASDDHPNLRIRSTNPRFPTFQEAFDAAINEYSEYGVQIHPECTDAADPDHTTWYHIGRNEGLTQALEALNHTHLHPEHATNPGHCHECAFYYRATTAIQLLLQHDLSE